MGFTCGIIGLPNAGKSTIFNALTGAAAMVASYPFCTIEPNHGIVPVPDARLERLAVLLGKKSPIPTRIEFVDVAGLVRGASKGEGLGNQFLGHIRTVDSLVHVVRCFESADALHVMGSVDPARDIEVVNTECVLADLQVVERSREKEIHAARAGVKEASHRVELAEAMIRHLDSGAPLRTQPEPERFSALLAELGVITAKPVLYLASRGEDGAEGQAETVRAAAAAEGAGFVSLAGKLEEEVGRLDPAEREQFAKELGIERTGLDRLVESAYAMLSLATFYTATTDLQAWTVPEGTPADRAAGRIHTDMERGFIRAEVVGFADLQRAGSMHRARELGSIHPEGRDYVVKDGDVIHFLFNV